MYDSVRVAHEDTTNDDHLAVDLGLGSQLHVTENRDDIAPDFAVDVDIPDHRYCGVTNGSGYSCITKNRHNYIVDFAGILCRAKNGDDRVGVPALRKHRVVTY